MCTFIGMAKQEFKVELTDGQTVNWNPVMTSAAEALGLVVVSAGRFEQDASEVTVSLEVLKPALVENKATTTLETAIEQTPGVSLVDGEPQIRSGSGFSYGAGSRVMVLVDDLPVLSGDAGRPTWGFLPLENLEQIEVIKGASSVLYGSAALSGVINIRTRYPDARPLTRVSLQHGMYSDPRSAEEEQILGRHLAAKQPPFPSQPTAWRLGHRDRRQRPRRRRVQGPEIFGQRRRAGARGHRLHELQPLQREPLWGQQPRRAST